MWIYEYIYEYVWVFMSIYEYLEAMGPMMAPRWREVAAQWHNRTPRWVRWRSFRLPLVPFGLILVPFWVPVASFWLPLSPFGYILSPCGSIWSTLLLLSATCSSLFVLHSALFGSLWITLAPFCYSFSSRLLQCGFS